MSPGRIGLVEGASLAQAALAPTRFTRQQVAQVCTLMFDAAVFGEPETLRRGAARLNLRHLSPFSLAQNIYPCRCRGHALNPDYSPDTTSLPATRGS